MFTVLQMYLIHHELVPHRYHFTVAMQNILPKVVDCGCLKGTDKYALCFTADGPFLSAVQQKNEWKSFPQRNTHVIVKTAVTRS